MEDKNKFIFGKIKKWVEHVFSETWWIEGERMKFVWKT